MRPFQNITDVGYGAQRGITSERRQSLQLLYYWDDLRDGRIMPIEDDIDPKHSVIRDIWDQCFILQTADLDNEKLNYTYLGPAIVDAYRNELTPGSHPQLVSLDAAKLGPAFRQVASLTRPIMHSGEYNEGGGDIVKFRQCLLPLGRDRVEVIFGHMTYQVYPQMMAEMVH